MEQALRRNDRASWPINFDFKDVQAPLLQAVWQLPGEYRDWITTASKTVEPRELASFEPKPLLAITEDSDAQGEVFFREFPDWSRALFRCPHLLLPGPPRRRVNSPAARAALPF